MVDHASTECLALHVPRRSAGFEALQERAKAAKEFRQRDNPHWLVERLKFQPTQHARQRLLAFVAAA